MKKRDYLVITFSETTMALYMERTCRADQKEGRIIPLPKEISAGCGLAWAAENKDQEEWREYLVRKKIDWEKMVEVLI